MRHPLFLASFLFLPMLAACSSATDGPLGVARVPANTTCAYTATIVPLDGPLDVPKNSTGNQAPFRVTNTSAAGCSIVFTFTATTTVGFTVTQTPSFLTLASGASTNVQARFSATSKPSGTLTLSWTTVSGVHTLHAI